MAEPKVSQTAALSLINHHPGELIAALLAHPETPEKIYNAIVDAVGELQHKGVTDRPEYLKVLLDLYRQTESGGVQ